MADEKLLNQTEAADFLGLGVQTLEAWRCRRKGPSYLKVGAAVRYRMSDLEKWLESRTVKCGGGQS